MISDNRYFIATIQTKGEEEKNANKLIKHIQFITPSYDGDIKLKWNGIDISYFRRLIFHDKITICVCDTCVLIKVKEKGDLYLKMFQINVSVEDEMECIRAFRLNEYHSYYYHNNTRWNFDRVADSKALRGRKKIHLKKKKKKKY